MAVDQKLYIPVKWIHILPFVSLLFRADLGNIWYFLGGYFLIRKSPNKIKVGREKFESGWVCVWKGGGTTKKKKQKKLFLLAHQCFCISRYLVATHVFFTYLHFNPWNTRVNPFVCAGAQPGLNCRQPQPPVDSTPSLTSGSFLPSAPGRSRMVSGQWWTAQRSVSVRHRRGWRSRRWLASSLWFLFHQITNCALCAPSS